MKEGMRVSDFDTTDGLLVLDSLNKEGDFHIATAEEEASTITHELLAMMKVNGGAIYAERVF